MQLDWLKLVRFCLHKGDRLPPHAVVTSTLASLALLIISLTHQPRPIIQCINPGASAIK